MLYVFLIALVFWLLTEMYVSSKRREWEKEISESLIEIMKALNRRPAVEMVEETLETHPFLTWPEIKEILEYADLEIAAADNLASDTSDPEKRARLNGKLVGLGLMKMQIEEYLHGVKKCESNIG